MVNGADVRTLDRHALAHLLGSRVAFYSRGKDNDTPADQPPDLHALAAGAPTRSR